MSIYSSEDLFKNLKDANKISSASPQETYKIGMKMYNFASENSMKLEKGFSLITLCLACRSMSKIKEWLNYAHEALSIFQELNHIEGQVRSLNFISIAYFYSSIFDKSLYYSLIALDLCPELEDKYLYTCVLNNIGEVYTESKNFDLALEYYQKAFDLSIKHNFLFNRGYILKNMGCVYLSLNRTEHSLKTFNESFQICIDDDDIVAAGEVENKIGDLYVKLNNLDLAHTYYEKALEKLEKVESKFYSIDSLIGLAKVCFLKDSYVSLSYLHKALSYATSLSSSKKLCAIYELLYKTYEKNSDLENAMIYIKNYYSIKEQMNTLNITYKLEVLNFEMAKLNSYSKIEEFLCVNEQLEKELLAQQEKLKSLEEDNQILSKKALYDNLTELPNRHFLETYSFELWNEFNKSNKNIAVFIFDIDNFKSYNDYWGHKIGDSCLKKVASILDLSYTKIESFSSRYGGEEFVIILKDVDYEKAILIGEEIRAKVESLGIYRTHNKKLGVVTISVGGVLGTSSELISISNAIFLADKELYNCKENGKNKVSILHC